MQEVKERKTVGRYGNMVRLNVWIMAAQDRGLGAYCQLTQKSKSEAIREVLQLGLNMLRKDGVI